MRVNVTKIRSPAPLRRSAGPAGVPLPTAGRKMERNRAGREGGSEA